MSDELPKIGDASHLTATGEAADAEKRIKEPCTKCRYFYYPKSDSQEYKEIEARLASLLSRIPAFQHCQFPGYDSPKQWGVCKKLNGMIHCVGNTCEHWKPRGIFGAFGLHTAKDRRDA